MDRKISNRGSFQSAAGTPSTGREGEFLYQTYEVCIRIIMVAFPHKLQCFYLEKVKM